LSNILNCSYYNPVCCEQNLPGRILEWNESQQVGGFVKGFMMVDTVASSGVWIGFSLFILAAIAFDLGVFTKKDHEIKMREAALYTGLWILLAFAFNLLVLDIYGQEPALAFLTGYLVEKALSVDNIFVFIILFSYFKVEKQYHHRVLVLGILGAIIMRGVFIFAGVALMEAFHWLFYILGALLIFTGLKLLKEEDINVKPEEGFIYRTAKRLIPMVPNYHGGKFFVRQNGKLFATPMFLVLIAIETTDLVFATDSIPAILAITNDPFILITSNVFAILGLRALYFLLSGAMVQFAYLRFGLAVILMFIGVKMLIEPLYKIPMVTSLIFIALVLLFSIVFSLLKARKAKVAQH